MTINELIKILIDKETPFIRFITDTDGNIEDISIETINKQNAIAYCSNMLLQNLLQSCYGIDISSIVPTGLVEDTDKRVIELTPILTNFDISESYIIGDSGTDVLVSDYIYDKFQIQDWNDFIDTIFKGIRQCIYTAVPMLNKNIDFKLDEKTNKMIGTLACTLARYNSNFEDITLGDEDQIINIPLDLENVNDTFTYLGNLLIDKGYVDESLRDNFTISGWMQFSLNPVTGATGNAFTNNIGFNNNGEFKYLHCYIIDSIINSNQHVWTPVIFATRKEIKPIVFEQASVNYNNLNGYVGYKAHLYDKTTGAEDMTKQYMVWYGRNHGNDSGSSYQNIWYDMATQTQIFADNELINGADETYNVYYNGGLGRGNSVNYNELGTNVNFPIRRWNSVYVSSDFVEIFLNNEMVIHGLHLNIPIVDSLTSQNLDDNDIELKNDNKSKWLHIIASFIGFGVGLIPNLTPFDTTHKLKIATIDRINKLLLDTHSKVTQFIKTSRASYLDMWKNALTIDEIMPPNMLGFVRQYYLPDTDALRDLAKDFFALSDWSEITDRDPMESILKFHALPFILKSGKDYKPYDPHSVIATKIKVYDDGQVPIMFGDDACFKSHGFLLKPGRVNISFDLAPIEIHNDFTDYEPYTKASIWIPFLGYRNIDTSLIIKQQLKLVYTIDVATGDFVVRIYTNGVLNGTTEVNDYANVTMLDEYEAEDLQDDNDASIDAMPILSGNPIFFDTGNMAYPLTMASHNNNATETLKYGLQGVGNIVSGIVAGALGTGPAGVVGGLIGGATSFAQAAITHAQGSAVQSKGTFGSGNWMGHRRPYITIYYKQPIDDMEVGTAFDETVGHKSSYGLRIKDMKPGYHKLKAVKLDGLRCTLREKEMIRETLMNGFYYGLSKKRVKTV